MLQAEYTHCKSQRLKERYESSITDNQQDPNIPHKEKSYSQSPKEPVEEHSRKTLQSKTEVYKKNASIIYLQEGEKLHRAQFLETGSRMLKVVELFPDKSFSLE